jgi:transcription elongation factor GreA
VYGNTKDTSINLAVYKPDFLTQDTRLFMDTVMPLQKFYVTKQGLERVQQEYKKLKEFKHQKTMGETPNILHSEDANPEYLAFQEDMSLLDARLAEYENILQNAELIIKPPKAKTGCVDLGATVICEVDGEQDEFTIVGSLESNPAAGRISNESPVGRALLGRKIGEAVTVNSSVVVTYKILGISYE